MTLQLPRLATITHDGALILRWRGPFADIVPSSPTKSALNCHYIIKLVNLSVIGALQPSVIRVLCPLLLPMAQVSGKRDTSVLCSGKSHIHRVPGENGRSEQLLKWLEQHVQNTG